jgi:hypothetical protein
MRSCTRAAFLILFSFVLASDQAYADVCEDIQKIYKQALGGFSQWAGKEDPDSGDFASSFRLEGASDCYINMPSDNRGLGDYICTWPMKTEQEIENAVKRISGAVRECSFLSGGELQEFSLDKKDEKRTTTGTGFIFRSSDERRVISIHVSGSQTKRRSGPPYTYFMLSVGVDKGATK